MFSDFFCLKMVFNYDVLFMCVFVSVLILLSVVCEFSVVVCGVIWLSVLRMFFVIVWCLFV